MCKSPRAVQVTGKMNASYSKCLETIILVYYTIFIFKLNASLLLQLPQSYLLALIFYLLCKILP